MYIHLNFHWFLSILFLSFPIIWFLSSNLTWKIFWNHFIEALFLFNRYESHCVVHGTWSFTSSFSNQLGGITVSLLPAFYGPMGDSFLGACRASAVQEKNFYHCVTYTVLTTWNFHVFLFFSNTKHDIVPNLQDN